MPGRFPGATILVALLCWSLCGTGWSQDAKKIAEILRKAPGPGAKKAPAQRPKVQDEKKPVPVFLLRDRGKIPARPAFDSIRVRTRYGVLDIPNGQLVTVRLAPRLDGALVKKTTALLALMGTGTEADRKAAADSLLALGPPALAPLKHLAATAGGDLPGGALAVIEKLELEAGKNPPPKNKRVQARDEIRTDELSFRGEVLTESFALKTLYGELTIRIADLEAINFKAVGLSNRSVIVTPNYQPSGTWLDTRLDVGKNKLLSIKASGQTSVENWNVKAGPAGTTRYNSFKSQQGFPMLCLVGKIGKSGKPFKIAEKYRLRSKTAGRLYLAIQPFDYEPGGVAGKYESVISITDGR